MSIVILSFIISGLMTHNIIGNLVASNSVSAVDIFSEGSSNNNTITSRSKGSFIDSIDDEIGSLSEISLKDNVVFLYSCSVEESGSWKTFGKLRDLGLCGKYTGGNAKNKSKS